MTGDYTSFNNNETAPRHSIVIDRLKEWLCQSAWPGLGLFGESFLLFSIGTLKPLWEIIFPDCFSYEQCSPRLLHSLTYSVVVGIILGMINLGYIANTIGRRNGSILTALLMTIGAVGMFLVSCFLVDSPPRMYQSMSIFLCIFGVGIGGEYPLSASSASEKAMQNSLLGKKSQHGEERDEIRGIANNQEGRTRGRQIQLVFTMQGLGIWTQTIMLMVLLVITGQAGNNEDGYDLNILMNIWRITYLIGAAVLVFVLISRFIYLNESQVWAHDQQQQENQQSSKSIHSQSNHVNNEANDQIGMKTNESSTRLLLRMYGARLLGTSMSWLLWDISFYGNKLFQSSFLLAIMGQDISLLDYTMAAALNSTVALFGYFGAAYLIDHPNVGRLRLQFFGFMITGLLFLICGLSFEHLPSEGLVILYLLTSFFGQLGPNATTFLVPAEIFPTEQRTLCHGTSAAAGKFGALIAAFLFNFLNNDADLFLMCGYASFIACLLTFFTIPDTTNMDLLEIDRKWRMAANGVDENYNGPANDPRFLSFYERQQIESQF